MQSNDVFLLKTMSFGRLLRHFRVARMCTIGELARAAALAKSHISQLEHGLRRPGFRALRQLTNALQLNQEEFAIFCDSAVTLGESNMRDLPDSNSSLCNLLGGQTDARTVRLHDLHMPPTSMEEEQFLQEAKSGTKQTLPAFTGVHACSPAFPPPPEQDIYAIEAL